MAVTVGFVIDTIGPLPDFPACNHVTSTKLADGGFAVAGSGDFGTILRISDAAGVFERSEFIPGTEAEICQTEAGTLVVITRAAADNYRVTLLDKNNEVTDQFTTDFGIAIADFSITALKGDKFAVAQTDPNSGNGDPALDIFDGATYTTSLFPDATPAADSNVVVTMLANGDLAMAWLRTDAPTGTTSVVYKVMKQDGTTVKEGTAVPGAEVLTDVAAPAIVTTADGFAIAYEGRRFSSIGTDIRLDQFDLAGEYLATDLITNRLFNTTGIDDGTDDSDPALALADDGNIAITWTSNDGNDTNQNFAFLSALDSSGRAGFFQSEDPQGSGTISFFGEGQIAVYLVNGSKKDVTGEHFAGFRDTAGDKNDNTLTGDSFKDLMNGVEGNDVLRGFGNDDEMQGGDGSDRMFGGAGNDYMTGEEGLGAQGGGRHGDQMFGGEGNDSMFGETGNDKLVGGSGSDSLSGEEGNDNLRGGSQNDILSGGEGSDSMTGDKGADTFHVAELDSVDTITDFKPGVDHVELDLTTFTALGSGVFASNLRIGAVAADADDFLIYNSNTGILSYDADASGGSLAVPFLNLGAGLSITAADFTVI